MPRPLGRIVRDFGSLRSHGAIADDIEHADVTGHGVHQRLRAFRIIEGQGPWRFKAGHVGQRVGTGQSLQRIGPQVDLALFAGKKPYRTGGCG